MRPGKLCATALGVFLATAYSYASPGDDKIVQLQTAYDRSYATSLERSDAVQGVYDHSFGSQVDRSHLAKESNANVQQTFDAAALTASLTLSKSTIDDARLALGELERRGIADGNLYKKYWGLLVKARRLNEANDFRTQHATASLIQQPVIDGPSLDGKPHVLRLSPDEKKLIRDEVPVTHGAWIVIVGHPACHFTANAVSQLAADPVVQRLLKNHAYFLMPPRDTFDFDLAADWARAHPYAAMHVIEYKNDWQMIDGWDTPTFYFLKDGNVEKKLVGWPKDGHKAEFLEDAAAVGLASQVIEK